MTNRRRAKSERLADEIQIAAEVYDLFKHELVLRWFQREMQKCLIKSHEFAGRDGDGCRIAMLEHRILNDLYKKLSGLEAGAMRAVKELSEMDESK